MRPDDPIDIIPPQLLRIYVAYARKYAHPTLCPEACKLLQAVCIV